MKFWLSKNSEVPVREQLVTQITIGIASGDLPVGTRLPSTREIAHRYKVHSNTVSHAYQLLAEQGWLEFRKGSGFYVRRADPEKLENSLDQLIAQFVQNALQRGFSIDEIKKRLAHYFQTQGSKHLFVIENDRELREILMAEIRNSTKLLIKGISLQDFESEIAKTGVNFAAMFHQKTKIGAFLPADKTCIFLKTRSVAEEMKDKTRPTENDLIAVVSGWPNFLVMAKTMLVAARIEPESLIVRSTGEKNWQKGLAAASMIICDSLTAEHFEDDGKIRPFRLIADDSLEEISKLSN